MKAVQLEGLRYKDARHPIILRKERAAESLFVVEERRVKNQEEGANAKRAGRAGLAGKEAWSDRQTAKLCVFA